MIIVINDVSDMAADPDKIQAFSNILMAFGEGKHVLWMPSKKVLEVIESGEFSGRNLKILHELKDSARLTKSILDEFDFFIDVNFTTRSSTGFVEPNRLVLSYLHFIDSASVQLPVFVAENLSDIDFYMLGSKVYLREAKLLSAYDVSFRHIAGGGNTTITSFRYNLSRNELVLCILDSDKKHPAAGVQTTAARFSNYPLGWGVNYWLHILECTEAENLVPWRVAEAVLSEIPGAVFQKFLQLTPEIRRYVDHKEGLTYSDALDTDARHGAEFWGAHFSEDFEPEAWICEPLGARFLEKCIEYMSGITIHKLAEMIDERDMPYVNICRMVASWGIGPKRAIR